MREGALVSACGGERREQPVGLIAGGEQSTEVVEDEGSVADRLTASVRGLERFDTAFNAIRHPALCNREAPAGGGSRKLELVEAGEAGVAQRWREAVYHLPGGAIPAHG